MNLARWWSSLWARSGTWPELAYAELFRALVARRLSLRHRGTMLGSLWLVFQPVALAVVFALVFDRLLRLPVTQAQEGTLGVVLFIYLGVLIHQYLAEQIALATTSIVSEPQYVKKVAFPLPLIGWSHALAGLVPLAAGLVVAALLAILVSLSAAGSSAMPPLSDIPLVSPVASQAANSPSVWQVATSLPWLVLVLVSLLPWALALQWMLGALGVYVRDLTQIVPALNLVLMWFSPVFYTLDRVSDAWRSLLLLSPLTVPIEVARAALAGGAVLEAWGRAILAYGLAGLTLMLLARWLFGRLAHGFADVL